MTATALAPLIQVIAELEERTTAPLRLPDVQKALAALGPADAVGVLLEQDVLLSDQRLALDQPSGEMRPVRLCRLNRRHPAVVAALADTDA